MSFLCLKKYFVPGIQRLKWNLLAQNKGARVSQSFSGYFEVISTQNNKTCSSSNSFYGTFGGALCLIMALYYQNGKNESHAARRRIQDVYAIIEKPIGQGAFGHVCVGQHHETKEVVAVKKIPKQGSSLLKVLEEVDILRVASEIKSVPSFRDFFIGNDHYYIVMEMAKGGELFDFLVRKGLYTEKEAQGFVLAVAECLACLHSQGIVHFDIKPENIMLAKQDEKEEIMLADFGSSFRMSGGPKKGRQSSGTIAYSAPEVLSGEYCDSKADIWSLGVLMYIILSGVHPFDMHNEGNDDEVLENILHGNYSFEHPAWKRVSPEAIDLISKMLAHDPRKRPTAEEILKHAWFRFGTNVDRNTNLDISAENLKQFWRGRQKLKACLLACMVGLVDGVQEFWASAKDNDPHGQLVPGSRRTALRFIDIGQKGYITVEDLVKLMERMGEKATIKDLEIMLRSSSGDLRAGSKQVNYDCFMNLVPPICPARIYQKGEAIFNKGDLDDIFFLIKSGDVDLQILNINKQHVFMTLHQGDCLGEVELLTPSSLVPRVMSSYCSSETCEVLAIPENLFAHLRDKELLPSMHETLTDIAEARVQAFLRGNIKVTLSHQELVVQKGGTVFEQSNRKDVVLLVEEGCVLLEYVDSTTRVLEPGTLIILRTENRSGSKYQNVRKITALSDAKLLETPAPAFFEFLSRHNMAAVKYHFANQEIVKNKSPFKPQLDMDSHWRRYIANVNKPLKSNLTK